MFIAQDKRKKEEILSSWSLYVMYVSLHELHVMTPSEATDLIVAELAACPSVARKVVINTLMAEILLSACMAPVLASLECNYCILKAAGLFISC
jgi:hypothetical protein